MISKVIGYRVTVTVCGYRIMMVAFSNLNKMEGQLLQINTEMSVPPVIDVLH